MKTLSRQAIYYHRKRNALMAELGAQCAYCGTTQDLTFDIKTPKHWTGEHHEQKSSCARIAFYWREYLDGNVQVLCQPCNTRKSNTPHAHYARQLNLAIK